MDYNETLTTARTILAVVAQLDLEPQQVDVLTAFQNGDLREDVCMSVLEGLNSDSTKKSIKTSKITLRSKTITSKIVRKEHVFLMAQLG